MSNPLQNQQSGQYVPVDAPQARVQSAPVAAAPMAQQQSTNQENDRGHSLDFISTDNRENEYRQAVKHSRNVKFWKVAFPVIGVIVIMVLAGALVLKSIEVPEVAVDNINLDSSNLVMENPKLNGFDKNKRPFSLTALTATQDVSNPSQVELEEITAELPLDDTIIATIKAGNGFYDADAKTLNLKETVNLVTSNGMVVNLQDADIDIGNSTMLTNNPITATSPQADISSRTMRVEDGGNKMTFEGSVRLTLRPDELRKTSEPNEQN